MPRIMWYIPVNEAIERPGWVDMRVKERTAGYGANVVG